MSDKWKQILKDAKKSKKHLLDSKPKHSQTDNSNDS